jgi:hypothetical protein
MLRLVGLMVHHLRGQRDTRVAQNPAMSGAGAEALTGSIERVTFHNPDNGFAVLRVKARNVRDLATVVGQPDESRVILGRTRRDSLKLAGYQALISLVLVLVVASPALMTTFTASSIGSLKGTSIRSRPFA